MDFLKEFWEFLKVRKKYWLLPILISFSIIWWTDCLKSRLQLWLHLFTQFFK